MLHQGQGEADPPEMDWDYYGIQDQTGGQPQYERSTSPRKSNRRWKGNFKEGCFHTFGRGILFPKLWYFWTLSDQKAVLM